MKICLYGAGSKLIDDKYKKEAYELGKEIANKGHKLVYGGGNTGIMGATSQGVIDNGGEVLGIAPEWMKNYEGMCKSCSKFIHTKTMDERKSLFLKHSDAFVVAPGGIGTLDEFFEILTLRRLERHHKKIVIFNSHGFYNHLLSMMDFLYKEQVLVDNIYDLFYVADTIEEVFNYLEN
jgi:uncharacterized protein (TIGR00730 family)